MFPNFELCCSAFEKYGLSLDRNIYDKLSVYCDFLIEYNRQSDRYNRSC